MAYISLLVSFDRFGSDLISRSNRARKSLKVSSPGDRIGTFVTVALVIATGVCFVACCSFGGSKRGDILKEK